MIYISFEDVVFTLYYFLGINYIEPKDISVETIEVFAKYWMQYLEKKHISVIYVNNKASIKTFARDYDQLFVVNKESIGLKRAVSYKSIYESHLINKPKEIFSFMYDPAFINKIITLHFNSIKKEEEKKAALYVRK